MSIRRTLSALLLLALALLAFRAEAMDEVQRRAAFSGARNAIERKNWGEALRLCQELWADRQTFDVALQLGLVEINLDRYAEAATHLSFGIANIPPKEPEQTLTRARDLYDFARARAGRLELSVEPANAELRLDGALLGRAPLPGETFVAPGEHVLEATFAGFAPKIERFPIGAGETVKLVLLLSESKAIPILVAGKSPGPAPSPDRAPADRTGVEPRTVVLIAGGVVTAGLLTAGVVKKVQAANAQDDADALQAQAEQELGHNCPVDSGNPTCQSLSAALERRNASNQVGNYLLVGSAVAAAATVGILLALPASRSAAVGRPAVGRPAVQFSFAPDGASVGFSSSF